MTVGVELGPNEGARGASGRLSQGDQLAVGEGGVDSVDLQPRRRRQLELPEGYRGVLNTADNHPVHRGGERIGGCLDRHLHRLPEGDPDCRGNAAGAGCVPEVGL